ncbi:Hypothetical_protein [Hexamita inflata]|uniref:Hypothetical_protein n=1 Tax=Hexamita inflata TaxID=28002 RepID=A0ABP1GLK8_9EUKA
MDSQHINNNQQQGNYFYAEYRYKYTPMSVYQKPLVPRIYAYLSMCLVVVGAILLITYSQNNQPPFLVGGLFAAACGIMFASVSASACIEIRSFTYVVAPCLVSEERRQEIAQSAHERTPIINFIPFVVNQI